MPTTPPSNPAGNPATAAQNQAPAAPDATFPTIPEAYQGDKTAQELNRLCKDYTDNIDKLKLINQEYVDWQRAPQNTPLPTDWNKREKAQQAAVAASQKALMAAWNHGDTHKVYAHSTLAPFIKKLQEESKAGKTAAPKWPTQEALNKLDKAKLNVPIPIPGGKKMLSGFTQRELATAIQRYNADSKDPENAAVINHSGIAANLWTFINDTKPAQDGNLLVILLCLTGYLANYAVNTLTDNLTIHAKDKQRMVEILEDIVNNRVHQADTSVKHNGAAGKNAASLTAAIDPAQTAADASLTAAINNPAVDPSNAAAPPSPAPAAANSAIPAFAHGVITASTPGFAHSVVAPLDENPTQEDDATDATIPTIFQHGAVTPHDPITASPSLEPAAPDITHGAITP